MRCSKRTIFSLFRGLSVGTHVFFLQEPPPPLQLVALTGQPFSRLRKLKTYTPWWNWVTRLRCPQLLCTYSHYGVAQWSRCPADWYSTKTVASMTIVRILTAHHTLQHPQCPISAQVQQYVRPPLCFSSAARPVAQASLSSRRRRGMAINRTKRLKK